jgi:hypothetical protein
MSTDELTDVLERWCDAVAAAELAPEGSPERDAAELRVRRLDLRVRRAALRLTGRRDQLEDAIEATWGRLAASNAALDGAWRSRLDTIAQHVDHDRS